MYGAWCCCCTACVYQTAAKALCIVQGAKLSYAKLRELVPAWNWDVAPWLPKHAQSALRASVPIDFLSEPPFWSYIQNGLKLKRGYTLHTGVLPHTHSARVSKKNTGLLGSLLDDHNTPS